MSGCISSVSLKNHKPLADRKLSLTRLVLLTLSIFVSANVSALQVGQDVPAVSLPTLTDDRTLDLASMRGKVVLVDFWASWCGPCRKSFPQLNSLYNSLHTSGFEIYSIGLDREKDEALAFVEKNPVDYAVVYDVAQKSPEDFHLKGMPSAYLIDKNGKVSYLHEGFEKSDLKKIEAKIRSLLKGSVE